MRIIKNYTVVFAVIDDCIAFICPGDDLLIIAVRISLGVSL